MSVLKVLDLFSGIGGFSLGLERTGGFKTIAFCEIEEFPRKVLRKHWPDVPIFNDIKELHAADLPERPNVITGGYPCQPFSLAGKRRGKEDDRHLWPEMFRLVRECRPSWVIGENVAGHINMGLDEVLSDLEGEGYTARTFIIPACAKDAPHRRDRVWIVANSKCNGRITTQKSWGPKKAIRDKQARENNAFNLEGASCLPATEEDVAHSICDRLEGSIQVKNRGPKGGKLDKGCSVAGGISKKGSLQWPVEPGVGRVANGIPPRVDRIKGLGNAVVPQIPEAIGYAILAAHCSD